MRPHHICGEIQYDSSEGLVHSDICYNVGAMVKIADATNYRRFLHANLDEWLDRSDGSGFFYIGNTDDLKENFRDS